MANDIVISGYPTTIGSKWFYELDHYGPASYNQTTGDIYPVTNINQGGFDRVSAGYSFSGTYQVQVRYASTAIGTGVTSVALRWMYTGLTNGVDNVVIASAGTGQTNGTYSIASSGGGGTGATVSVVVAGGAVTQVTVTNAGRGYTSAPTFTVAAGGTPGTLTATVGPVPAGEVPTGTNLSAEAVRMELVAY